MKRKFAAMLVIMSLACIQLAGCGQEEKRQKITKNRNCREQDRKEERNKEG